MTAARPRTPLPDVIALEDFVAEDEGHGFANPENRMRLNRAIERHFAEHLGGRRSGG